MVSFFSTHKGGKLNHPLSQLVETGETEEQGSEDNQPIASQALTSEHSLTFAPILLVLCSLQ